MNIEDGREADGSEVIEQPRTAVPRLYPPDAAHPTDPTQAEARSMGRHTAACVQASPEVEGCPLTSSAASSSNQADTTRWPACSGSRDR